MKSAMSEEKAATESGYFPLFHYNPSTDEFKIDSKSDFSGYEDFLLGENRYLSLTKINKNSKEIFKENKKDSEDRLDYYESLISKGQ